MTGGEVLNFDQVFIVIKLHHFDPSSCVVGDEPMMVEGLWESFVAARVVVVVNWTTNG